MASRRYFVTDREGYEHLRSQVAGLPENFDSWQAEREQLLAHEEQAGVVITPVYTHRRVLVDFAHWCTQTKSIPNAETLDVWLNAMTE